MSLGLALIDRALYSDGRKERERERERGSVGERGRGGGEGGENQRRMETGGAAAGVKGFFGERAQ